MTDPKKPVLPDRSKDDQDVAWGERNPTDDEEMQRLLDERPPHHEDRD
jgi:hypothetical protein